MKVRLLVAGFLLSATSAISQSGCIVPFECVYYTIEGYRVCARLEPVMSTGRSGPVAILDDDGFSPEGCTCMHPDTAEIWLADPLNPQLAPLYEQMEEDARVRCEALALEQGADPLPCDTATLDVPTAVKDDETSSSCDFVVEYTDEDKDGVCPPLDGVDEVGYTTDSDSTEDSDSGSDTGVLIPDLPKQP